MARCLPYSHECHQSLDATGAAPPTQRVAPPEREHVNKSEGLLVDPRSLSLMMSRTQDSVDRESEEATTERPLWIVISWCVQVRKCACGTRLFALMGTYLMSLLL